MLINHLRPWTSMPLMLFLWLLPSLGLAQTEWETLRFNKTVSFSFPSEYEEFDTLGQKSFRSKSDFGLFLAEKIPNPQAQILDSAGLIDYYTAFQKVTMERSHGTASYGSTFKVNDLYARGFQFERYWNGSLELQQHMIFFIDRYMYSFTYTCRSRERLLARQERERFFSSIVIHNTDFEDQLTVPNTNERIGGFIGYIFRYVSIAAVVLVVILAFLEKYRYVRLIKNIFSWIFLLYGAFSIVLYFGDLFFGINVYFLLASGVICLIIGILLRIIKVPRYNKV
jgi:hypothetical protein